MAYYTNLINAWNSATQPPTGVTGTALTGLNTAAKIAAVNGWTVAGPAVPANITPSQIINCIDTVAHVNALTAVQIAMLQFLAGSGQPIYAPPGSTIRALFTALFTGQTTTLANFAALIAQYDSPPQPWWQANGLSGPITAPDLLNAGGLT